MGEIDTWTLVGVLDYAASENRIMDIGENVKTHVPRVADIHIFEADVPGGSSAHAVLDAFYPTGALILMMKPFYVGTLDEVFGGLGRTHLHPGADIVVANLALSDGDIVERRARQTAALRHRKSAGVSPGVLTVVTRSLLLTRKIRIGVLTKALDAVDQDSDVLLIAGPC